MPARLTRFRATIRRMFFWLTPAAKTSSEQETESVRDRALVLSITKPKAIPKWRQLRYAGRVLNINERRTLALSIFLFFVFLTAGFILLAMDHVTTVPVVGGTYTEAVVGEPRAINPIDAPSNDPDADLVSLIYSGLFKMRGLEAEPDLAQKYEWQEDGKVLTVKIRDDAYFHNGQPVTAEDVLFTIEALQDPARGSALAPLFRGVKTVIIDRKTVQFILTQPDVTLLTSLTVGIMPFQLWQDIPATSARLANLNLKPIGSGAYEVKSFTRDNLGIIRSYTIERSERYYGIKPNIKTITFQFYPDRQAASDALKSDLVDSYSFIPSDEIDKFKSAARWQTIALEIPQQTIAFFNLKNKTLEDIRVRQALIQSVNKEDIIQAYNNFALITESPFPFLAAASSTEYNLDKARESMQNSGWVLPGNDSIRIYEPSKKTAPVDSNSSSTKLTLSILVPNEPGLLKIAEVLKRQWSLLGAQVEISAMEAREVLRKSSRDRDGQIILWNVLLRPDQDLFPIWWSGQAGDRGTNFSGLADKEVDALIEQTKQASSTESLLQKREALSNAVLKQSAAVFLARPKYGYVVSTRIKGISKNMILATPQDRFAEIDRWYIKTGLRWK